MTCLRRFVLGLAVIGGLVCGVTLPAQSAATYEPKVRVSGTIRVWGSPQMQDLLALYEKGFVELQPDVQFANELKSTLVAVPGVYTVALRSASLAARSGRWRRRPSKQSWAGSRRSWMSRPARTMFPRRRMR